MRQLRFTKAFEKDYHKLSKEMQARCDKALRQLLIDLRYPSLQVKKMEGFRYIWGARFSRGFRFTFMIDGEVYIIRRVGTHDILRNP